MLIRSTGLGRTLLTCKVVKIEVTHMVPATLEPPDEGEPAEPARLLMTIQTTDPVSWTVRGFVEPQDLVLILKAATTPAVIWAALKFLVAGLCSKKTDPAQQAKVGVPEQAKA